MVPTMAVFLANEPAIRIGMIVLATDELPPHLLAVLHAVLHVADAQVVSSRERVMAVGRAPDGRWVHWIGRQSSTRLNSGTVPATTPRT